MNNNNELEPKENGELEPKENRFCWEYLVDLNATQAAIRAGYSKRSAYSIGYENLQKHKIQTYINNLMIWRSLRTQVTADRVLEELAKIAFANEGVKIKDKLKALDMLAKHVCINDELLDLEKKAAKDEAKEGINDELLDLEEKALRLVLAREGIDLEKKIKNRKRELAEKGIKLDDNGEDQ